MGFQINPEEFEVTEENKKTDINYEMEDAIRMISFLRDRYQVRIKGIERRKTSLLQTVKVQVTTAAALIVLAIIVSVFCSSSGNAMAFAIWGIILFIVAGVITIINAGKALRSYCIHNGRVFRKSVYTLNNEQQDIEHRMKCLEDAEKQLENFLEQEQQEEEAGRLLLEGILPQLKEDERRADYLYGESARSN